MKNPNFDLALWTATVSNTLRLTNAERIAQLKKWGPQHHDLDTWVSILMEEVGELAKEVNNKNFDGVVSNASLEHEAVQVAAVALAIVQDLRDGVA